MPRGMNGVEHSANDMALPMTFSLRSKLCVPLAQCRRGEYHSPAGDQWSPLQ